jgi:hypothetical protein
LISRIKEKRAEWHDHCSIVSWIRKKEKATEDAMKKNNIYDKRNIRLDHILDKDFIPFLGGRPKRDKVISYDDILNLKIELNIKETVKEFVKNV